MSLKFQVQEQILDTKSLLDENNFYHQRQGNISSLTNKLTYIMGSYTNNYPLSMMTLGAAGSSKMRKNSAIEIDDIQYTYPVMGREIVTSSVAHTDYIAGDKPGINNSTFHIYFRNNRLKRFYIIESTNGIQAYILEDPVPSGEFFKYKVQLDPAEADEYCPLSELSPGAEWVELHTAVAESESRTTESVMSAPGSFKNQMGILRHGAAWAGNSANKVMNIQISVGNKSTNVWMDYFMWQFEKSWLDQCESLYWYSRYNRRADGSIPLKDLLTSKVIPRGSGVLEQIINKATYTKLTYDLLTNKIGDALFGQTDADSMSITLMTGRGGMREIDRCMKERGAQFLTSLGDVGDKFVTGTGRELMLGGYFNGFYHVDGYVIKVKHNPVFDIGRVAAKSPRHPESGLPLESYRMVFLDDNDVDGKPNIQHVAQKGRAFLDGVVKGLTPMPRSLEIKGGFDKNLNSALLSTDQDKSAYTRLKTAGICMLRGNRSFDLQCRMGLPN